tara:strand:+ start:330 stop:998 length:669 start_codon:yes stop_codon:yes gene_type:complete
MLTEHPPSERSAAPTPWGKADVVARYPRGIRSYSTPSHGGFCVPLRLADEHMPRVLREIGDRQSNGVWFEEDCDWAAVVAAFPTLFPKREVAEAMTTLANWQPDAFETHFGVILTDDESFKKAERSFYREADGRWIVRSALSSKTVKDYVLCIAEIGGGMTGGVARGEITYSDHKTYPEAHYLVHRERYDARGRFGHLIDTSEGDIEVTPMWFKEAWKACYD